MREGKVKDIVAVLLVLSHVIVIGTAFFPWLFGGLIEFADVIELLVAVIPLTAVYVTVVVSYYTAESNRYRTSLGERLNNVYLFFAFLFPFLYLAIVETMIIRFVYFDGSLTMDQLNQVFVIAESGFGIYAMKIVQQMFSIANPQAAAESG